MPDIHDFQYFFPMPFAGMPFEPFQVSVIAEKTRDLLGENSGR